MDILDTQLDDVPGMGVRTRNCLRNGAGFFTVREVMEQTDAQLLRVPTLGQVSLAEARSAIAAFLAAHGYKPPAAPDNFIAWCLLNRSALEIIRSYWKD